MVSLSLEGSLPIVLMIHRSRIIIPSEPSFRIKVQVIYAVHGLKVCYILSQQSFETKLLKRRFPSYFIFPLLLYFLFIFYLQTQHFKRQFLSCLLLDPFFVFSFHLLPSPVNPAGFSERIRTQERITCERLNLPRVTSPPNLTPRRLPSCFLLSLLL